MMGKSWRLSGVVINLILVAGLAAIWITFAPAKLGGQVSYVLVNGTSMEPGFHTGDLVIVRQASEYKVGDIVTYHDADMNANIIHRIVGTEQDRFVMKGDNNSWIDGYKPTRDEIIGKLWLHLVGLGAAVLWIKSPVNLALASGVIGGFFMVDVNLQKPNTNNKRKKKERGNPTGLFEILFSFCGILALVFLGLSIFTFSHPLMRSADKIQYVQIGNFKYTSTVTPGVYDTDSVYSGEPVFTNLTCTLNLEFVYVLVGKQLEYITGNEQFYAKVLDEQSGWNRTIPLKATSSFIGNIYTNTATLDLCQVDALVASVEKKTGYRINTYKLDIIANVSTVGIISGQKFTNTFEPHMAFQFDNLHYYISENSSTTDPMQTIQNDTISDPGMIQNTFHLFGLNLTVEGLRILSVLGLIIFLAGLLTLALIFNSASSRSQNAIIRLKYGSLLVDVYDQGLENHLPIIEVTTFEGLAKLAERQNATIMHLMRGLAHYYFIQIEGTTYRYVIGKD
ncbi:MAG: signal peptidase I [Anaerolineaceae bacterium]|nr:signal peptidase I [Anaerolineaceae bacterium]